MNLRCLAAAQLFELCAIGLRLPDEQLALALANGEYTQALNDALHALDNDLVDIDTLPSLATYCRYETNKLFHHLRSEYTRLFVGAPHREVAPYAGMYYAEKNGITPVLYVNSESMEVERFMLRCGIGRPKGTNEPLDHISSELEFLEYLVLDAIGLLKPEEHGAIDPNALEDFFSNRFQPFARPFADRLQKATVEPLYIVQACLLNALATTGLE